MAFSVVTFIREHFLFAEHEKKKPGKSEKKKTRTRK